MSKYPADGTMLLLLGIVVGDDIEIIDGSPFLNVVGHGLLPLVPASLDVLEHERGWIELRGEKFQATRHGAYWCEKWLNSRFKTRNGRLVCAR